MKDYKEVLRKLKEQGWTIKELNSHKLCIPPVKANKIVTVSGTPSDRRAYLNFISDLRRSGFRTKTHA